MNKKQNRTQIGDITPAGFLTTLQKPAHAMHWSTLEENPLGVWVFGSVARDGTPIQGQPTDTGTEKQAEVFAAETFEFIEGSQVEVTITSDYGHGSIVLIARQNLANRHWDVEVQYSVPVAVLNQDVWYLLFLRAPKNNRQAA